MAELILVVDDEVAVVDFLRLGLEYEGYQVESCSSGIEALSAIERQLPQLIILDVMLPVLDGLEVCRRVRSMLKTSDTPILMLTAKDEVEDRVQGLDAGADDYLVKPFAYRELTARVRALLRRKGRGGSEEAAELLAHGGVVLDRATREASRDGQPLDLTTREFDLLALLMLNARSVLPRQLIQERVWGNAFGGESNVIDVHVYSLRQKLGLPNVIQAVRGAGYVFRA